jgi:cation transport regulator ChaC
MLAECLYLLYHLFSLSISVSQHAIDQDDITWGVAYRIPESKVAETKAYLDHREKNGYETHFLDVYQAGSDVPVVEKVSYFQTEHVHTHKDINDNNNRHTGHSVYRING